MVWGEFKRKAAHFFRAAAASWLLLCAAGVVSPAAAQTHPARRREPPASQRTTASSWFSAFKSKWNLPTSKKTQAPPAASEAEYRQRHAAPLRHSHGPVRSGGHAHHRRAHHRGVQQAEHAAHRQPKGDASADLQRVRRVLAAMFPGRDVSIAQQGDKLVLSGLLEESPTEPTPLEPTENVQQVSAETALAQPAAENGLTDAPAPPPIPRLGAAPKEAGPPAHPGIAQSDPMHAKQKGAQQNLEISVRAIQLADTSLLSDARRSPLRPVPGMSGVRAAVVDDARIDGFLTALGRGRQAEILTGHDLAAVHEEPLELELGGAGPQSEATVLGLLPRVRADGGVHLAIASRPASAKHATRRGEVVLAGDQWLVLVGVLEEQDAQGLGALAARMKKANLLSARKAAADSEDGHVLIAISATPLRPQRAGAQAFPGPNVPAAVETTQRVFPAGPIRR